MIILILILKSRSGSKEAEKVRKEYISKLEEYNYFKDIGQVRLLGQLQHSTHKTQMLIGRIADKTGKAMKEVYKELDIEDD